MANTINSTLDFILSATMCTVLKVEVFLSLIVVQRTEFKMCCRIYVIEMFAVYDIESVTNAERLRGSPYD